MISWNTSVLYTLSTRVYSVGFFWCSRGSPGIHNGILGRFVLEIYGSGIYKGILGRFVLGNSRVEDQQGYVYFLGLILRVLGSRDQQGYVLCILGVGEQQVHTGYDCFEGFFRGHGSTKVYWVGLF